MESLGLWIAQYADFAHWIIFAAILLAGLNIPISADLIIVISALLAAQVVPEKTPHLFLAVLLGCLFSAWIAYWLGRIVGPKLLHIPFFSKILQPARLTKAKDFYEKYGFFALLIGRFIPFGVRNCIFMSAGMSKLAFAKFILQDLFACTIWSATAFYLFYAIGTNYQALSHYVKTFNILIFFAFGVTLIGWIWYKKRKHKISQGLKPPANND